MDKIKELEELTELARKGKILLRTPERLESLSKQFLRKQIRVWSIEDLKNYDNYFILYFSLRNEPEWGTHNLSLEFSPDLFITPNMKNDQVGGWWNTKTLPVYISEFITTIIKRWIQKETGYSKFEIEQKWIPRKGE